MHQRQFFPLDEQSSTHVVVTSAQLRYALVSRTLGRLKSVDESEPLLDRHSVENGVRFSVSCSLIQLIESSADPIRLVLTYSKFDLPNLQANVASQSPRIDQKLHFLDLPDPRVKFFLTRLNRNVL